jgi:hypothetical protein
MNNKEGTNNYKMNWKRNNKLKNNYMIIQYNKKKYKNLKRKI